MLSLPPSSQAKFKNIGSAVGALLAEERSVFMLEAPKPDLLMEILKDSLRASPMSDKVGLLDNIVVGCGNRLTSEVVELLKVAICLFVGYSVGHTIGALLAAVLSNPVRARGSMI